MTYKTAHKGCVIDLGRQGENLACTIVFPQTAAWKNIYGDGAVMIWHQRAAEDTKYPCAVTVSAEGYLHWPITRTETEFATEPMSRGRVEVQYIVGDVVVKSEIYETTVAEALGGDETEVPEVGAGWMESIGQVAATAEASAKRAEEAAQRAEDAESTSVTNAEIDGNGDLIITLSDGTVLNAGNAKGDKGDVGATGAAGPIGPTGQTGADGENGADGVSPSIKTEQTEDGVQITITDAEGAHTFLLTNGADGKDGKDGQDGAPGADGKDGADGQDGADGYTPVKGTDYWTDADKADMVADVIAALPVYDGEVV